MKLYFLRHGIAVESDEWNGNEFDRPLTSEGCERMQRQAKTMAKLDLAPDAIVTSPLVRARQTAQIAAQALKCRNIEEDDRLAEGFDVAKALAIAHEHSDAGAIMLVGHEPTMSRTIGALVGSAKIALKKGGLALVEMDLSARSGELLWLVPPKVLLAR